MDIDFPSITSPVSGAGIDESKFYGILKLYIILKLFIIHQMGQYEKEKRKKHYQKQDPGDEDNNIRK